jgi:hypothetical protein
MITPFLEKSNAGGEKKKRKMPLIVNTESPEQN